MLDFKNLTKYSLNQIKAALKNYQSGQRLYWIVCIVFIVLTATFGVTSVTLMCLYFTDTIHNQGMFYGSWITFALFVACLIVMSAMLITTKLKYTNPIRIIKDYLNKHEHD